MRFLTAAILALVLFATGTADARLRYVQKSGSDSNDGTASDNAHAWLTVTKASATLVAGDTVLIAVGDYVDGSSTWEHAFNPTNSGTAANPIVYLSWPRLAARFVARDSTAAPTCTVAAFGIQGKSYIVVDGFRVYGLLQCEASDHITFKNNDVAHGCDEGGDTSLNWGLAIHTSSYCTVQNNYVHDLGDSGNHTHNTGGIMLFGSATGSTYNTIINNTVDCSTGGNIYVHNAFGEKGGNLHHNTYKYNLARNANNGFLGMGSSNNVYSSDYHKYIQNIATNLVNDGSSPPQGAMFFFDHMCVGDSIINNTSYLNYRFIQSNYDSMPPKNWKNSQMRMWNNIHYTKDLEAIKQTNNDCSGAWHWDSLFVASNYNCFNGMTQNWAIGKNANAATLTAWKAATPFDANSASTYPAFADTAAKNFTISSGPAYGTGVDKGQIAGTDTTAAINMGAYVTGSEIIGYSPADSTGGLEPPAPDEAPIMVAPGATSITETVDLNFTVSASDPNGDAITSLTAAGTAIDAGATFTANGSKTGGTFDWTPTAAPPQAGSYSVTFTAANALSGTASTAITVTTYVAAVPPAKKHRRIWSPLDPLRH